MPKYSATMVSHSFWFAEFQAYIELLNAGYSEDDIRAKAEEDNYFKQKTAARTQDLLKVLKKRLVTFCLLYTSPSPRDYAASRMPSSA